jgi:hypothetical protein
VECRDFCQVTRFSNCVAFCSARDLKNNLLWHGFFVPSPLFPGPSKIRIWRLGHPDAQILMPQSEIQLFFPRFLFEYTNVFAITLCDDFFGNTGGVWFFIFFSSLTSHTLEMFYVLFRPIKKFGLKNTSYDPNVVMTETLKTVLGQSPKSANWQRVPTGKECQLAKSANRQRVVTGKEW